MTEDRKTFVVPDEYEAVRDTDGRATGEIRKKPSMPDVVTDEMVIAACKVLFGDKWTFVKAEMMRTALEAAARERSKSDKDTL